MLRRLLQEPRETGLAPHLTVREALNDPKLTDARLKAVLESLSKGDEEYWSFRGNALREHTHAYFQYPAMMVPQIQSAIIASVKAANPSVQTVYDPYMGSGTTLGEAMAQGMAYIGCDINPLAVLLCKAKSGPFNADEAKVRSEDLLARLVSDRKETAEVCFPNQEKWFEADVVVALSKIHRAVRSENALWFRRFVWVAVAATVRATSNSRTSTVKLHTRPASDIASRPGHAIAVFKDVLGRNIQYMKAQHDLLNASGRLSRNRYIKPVNILHHDSRQPLASSGSSELVSDLLLTSPSYGDNSTTVPYGQYSYLPLQWIDFSDIDASLDHSWLRSTHEIDYRSLGGSRKHAASQTMHLRELSPSFESTMEALKSAMGTGASRVAAHCRDLEACINPILASLRVNSYMFWTVGNRSVAGFRIPLDRILSELLCGRGACELYTMSRSIPSKRQASKNNYAQTMTTETILVMRKTHA